MTQKQRLLSALREYKDGLPVWRVIMPRPQGLGIAQYNARIYELRRQGYEIQSVKGPSFKLYENPVQLELV